MTTFCPTLITMPQEALIRNLGVMEEVRRASCDFARTAPCYVTVTTNPARLLNRLKLSGELRPCEPADLVTFRVEAQALHVEQVIVVGKRAGFR